MKLISLNDVCARTSLSRTSINKHRSTGTFPKAVPVSDTRIAFVETEIEKWIADRIAQRDGVAS